MPKSNIEFTVLAPIDEVWGLMSDAKTNTHCIPGCISCKIAGPDTAEWVLRFEAGPFAKKLVIKSKSELIDPPYHGKWVGSTKDARMSGEIRLKDCGNNTTKVKYIQIIELRGLIMRSVESLIKDKMDSDIRIYAKNIKKNLEIEMAK